MIFSLVLVTIKHFYVFRDFNYSGFDCAAVAHTDTNQRKIFNIEKDLYESSLQRLLLKLGI